MAGEEETSVAKRSVKRATKPVAKRAVKAAARSAKAPAPPAAPGAAPQVRRRRKSAHAALSKGTTVFQTDHGPRAAWPASTAKRKKR